MDTSEHDLYLICKTEKRLAEKIVAFAKQRGIELTIAIVGLMIGVATVLVSHKVGLHQEILQASRATDSYFNGVAELFAKTPDENQRINLVIIARTQAILDDLNQLNKPEKLAGIITFVASLNQKLFSKEQVSESPREKFINLSHMKLTGSHLRNVHLDNAQLAYANLQNADLAHSHLQAATLRKANLSGANLEFANFNNANLQGANLNKANVYQASFINSNLEHAIWVNGIRCKKGSIGYCIY